MFTKALFLLAALNAQSVYSSRFHGPAALPVVLHNGYLADTHEVAAAKSAHLATLSHQSQGVSYGHQGDSHYNPDGHHGDLRYHGPTANPHVLHDGHIADTHEVAAAKTEHYAAVAKARTQGGYQHSGQYASGYDHSSAGHDDYSGAHQGYGTHASYHGPIAIPHVLHDGHIADTHEVAAAKAEHYAAVAKARAHGGYHHVDDQSGQYPAGHDDYSGAHQGYGTHASYHGALAQPVVLSSGYLADTHEVSHAKQHHLQALHDAHHNLGSSHLYSS